VAQEYVQDAGRDAIAIGAVGGDAYFGCMPGEKKVKKKVLMLLTDPEGEEKRRRREEIRRVKAAKDRARNGDQFDVDSQPDVDAARFSQEVSKLEPFIIDIFGNEGGIEDLVFEKSIKEAVFTESEKIQLISDLFRVYSESVKSVECIILNGCYSISQAQEIVQHVEFVIGIDHALGEENITDFLEEFYYQVFSERGIKGAHSFGCNRVKRKNSKDIHDLLPKLLNRKEAEKRIVLETELKSCDEAILHEPSSIDLRKQRAKLLKELGRAEEATEAYEEVSLLAPNDLKIRTQQGKALVQLGKPSEAAIAFDQALKLERKDYKIWWRKAKALVEAGMHSEAIEAYEGAIALGLPLPDKYVILQEYASVLEKIEQYRKSIELYKKSLGIQPRYRVANYEKRQVYKKLYLDEDQSLSIKLN
jgi:Tfp pilus assembly protein PilF